MSYEDDPKRSFNNNDSRIRFWNDQGKECPLCERPILDPLNRDRDDPEACNVDHKIPRSHGGSDDRSNLQLTHIPCNSDKGCGCPPGEGHNRTKRVKFPSLPEPESESARSVTQRTWRAQDFKCAICGNSLAPSDLGSPGKARLSAGAVSHVRCIERLAG